MAHGNDLEGFSAWLLNRGRADSTAALYVRNVGYCMDDRRGLLARVARDGLAPTTRRAHLAALRAYGTYTRDADLLEQLGDLKLPAAERVTEKVALPLEDWQALIAALRGLRRPPAVRACCLMIAKRGFRVGDVLRIAAPEAERALEQGVLNYRGKGARRIAWSTTPFAEELAVLCDFQGWDHVRDLCTSVEGDATAVQLAARKRVQKAIRRGCALAGIEVVGPHILRRTYAWHVREHLGNDPVKLQKHMGWAKIDTAMAYIDQSERTELDALAEGLHEQLL